MTCDRLSHPGAPRVTFTFQNCYEHTRVKSYKAPHPMRKSAPHAPLARARPTDTDGCLCSQILPPGILAVDAGLSVSQGGSSREGGSPKPGRTQHLSWLLLCHLIWTCQQPCEAGRRLAGISIIPILDAERGVSLGRGLMGSYPPELGLRQSSTLSDDTEHADIPLHSLGGWNIIHASQCATGCSEMQQT